MAFSESSLHVVIKIANHGYLSKKNNFRDFGFEFIYILTEILKFNYFRGCVKKLLFEKTKNKRTGDNSYKTT